MKISVLVPTYRRPADLRRCLDALRMQHRVPDEIIVVARSDDGPTLALLAEYGLVLATLHPVLVDRPGHVQALNAGLRRIDGDIVAITDDDGAPHPDWVARIERMFDCDTRIAGVGGRDLLQETVRDGTPLRRAVGRLQWFGRVIGNHHIGCGPARRVHVLKNVNCAYRVTVLNGFGFDEALHGTGAQTHAELALGLRLVAEGWHLIYDPAIRVDHYPAPRHDIDQRNTFVAAALRNEIYNETLSILRYFGAAHSIVYVMWFMACGTRQYPGALCTLVAVLTRRPHAWPRLRATLGGRFEALRDRRFDKAPKARSDRAGVAG